MSTAAGWGASTWGSSPWGFGGSGTFGLLTLLGAVALRENAIQLEFSEPPVFNRLLTGPDASDPSHFSVKPLGGVSLDGEVARPVLPVLVEVAAVVNGGGRFLDVWLDRPMTGYPVTYQVTALGLVGAQSGLALVPGASAQFLGVRAGKAPPTAEHLVAGRDILIPQTARELEGSNVPGDPQRLVGTIPVDATGDYASGTPLAGYRTRVIRRASTVLGAYAHLPGTYGSRLPASAKTPFRKGQADLVAAQIEAQIRLEPETVSVTVTPSITQDGIARFKIVAAARFGTVDATLG